MTLPRLNPPTVDETSARLETVDWAGTSEWPEELLVFYHPDTLREIVSLRHYLLDRAATGRRDIVDDWIAMVALNRLTGHSAGFFSVYTLPPNQAVSVKSQIRINQGGTNRRPGATSCGSSCGSPPACCRNATPPCASGCGNFLLRPWF